MKKLYSFFICTLFSLSASSIGTVDYTKGLSVWFDTPNNLDGQAIWLRASGSRANPDKTWESRSLPIGNGSLGANILGSLERRTEYFERSGILLGRKQTIGRSIKRNPPGISG